MSDTHEIRDPVHGFVLFNDLEKELINSRPFQRLRDIKQLSLTYLVYPGATHTRFEHSIGTMEAVTQAFNVIVTRGGAALRAMLGWDKDADVERARQLVRLGALLHDVGHTPFSHGPEELLPGKKKHEAFTEKIILKSEISDIIARQRTPFRLTAKEIADVALGSKWRLASDVTTRVLAELVSGDLGADRIDYLVRDSLHAGVAYGKFDYPRLIRVKSHLSHQTSFGAA